MDGLRFHSLQGVLAAGVIAAAVVSSGGCGKPPVWNVERWQKYFFNSLSQSLPWDVEARKFSWGWQSGPEIVLDDIKIFSRNDRQVLMEAQKARAHISLRGILKRKIPVNSWSFENSVFRLAKNEHGKWNWLALFEKKPHASAFNFEFNNVEFSDAQVRFEDASVQPLFKSSFFMTSARMKRAGPDSPASGHATLKFPGIAQMGFQLSFSYTAQLDQLVFSLNSTDNRLELSGEAGNFTSDCILQFRAEVHHEDVRFLIPSEAGFQGFLTARLEGTSQGTHPAVLKRFLSLEGALDIREGAVSSRSVLSEVLGALKPVASVQPHLDKDFEGLLNRDQTSFDILQISLNVAQGQFYIDNLLLKQASYLVEGEGKVGMLDGLADFRARLICLEDLSAWLTAQDPEFKTFENEEGRVVVPFLYRGLLPDLSAEADWDILGSMLKQHMGPKITAEAAT